MSNLRRLGQEAEDQAAAYLLAQGYTIVTRRYKGRGGEIDLIALDDDILVFVEVKMRRSAVYAADEAVGPEKLRRLSRAAASYQAAMGEESRRVRFDLIAIDASGIRHFPAAFEPGLSALLPVPEGQEPPEDEEQTSWT
jgi:putative endonuclease